MSILSYIGLGSNVGDRCANLRRAVQELERTAGCTRVRCSSLYESDPWGHQDQAVFLNAVVETWTTLEPPRLLEELQRIEAELGRRREEERVRWGPRIIDLDLLLYGAVVLHEEGLEVPHPRLHERRFVLAPLCELNDQVLHPVLAKSARELLTDVVDEQRVRRFDR